MLPEFQAFKKIPRLRRDCVVTEKIDGTNAVLHIGEDGEVIAGSRSRWIARDGVPDHCGFGQWSAEHADELRKLGPGYHYGEWWGQKIQRGYGLDHRRFSLFNVARWEDPTVRPACCHIVPVLYRGRYDDASISQAMERLQETGSVAAPGFMKPEGIVVYHSASGCLFKATFDGDGHKGERDGVR